MRGYFLALLVASICTSLCSMLVSGGFDKYVKYVASLICVAVMVSPFRDIDFSEIIGQAENELSSIVAEENLLYKTSGEMTEESAENYINQMVFKQFGIKPLYSDIEIDWGEEDPVIEDIRICLSKEDFSRNSDVEKYLNDILGGEVKVIEG